MSAWQAAVSSTRKAAVEGGVHPIEWAAPGRYGPKRATGGSMRACTRVPRPPNTDRDAKSGMRAVAGEHRSHGTGWHPFKEAPPEGNASATRAAAPRYAACDDPGSDSHVPGKRSIFGIAGDRPCTPWLSPHQLPSTDLHLLRRDRAMNKPDWSTETLVRLEASSPAAKGGREKSTNSRKRVQGRGWHRRNAPGSLTVVGRHKSTQGPMTEEI